MLHTLIMAGGSGTRFWPASRAALPKQLLDLAGSQSMIQATVSRLGDLVAPEQILIMTNSRLVEAIRKQLPELPPASVVGEPCKRDTAPCIGLAAAIMARRDPDATMVVMPADHVIGPEEDFRAALRYAVGLVEEDTRRIVTFGIRPTYAAESFGYIERDAPVTSGDSAPATFDVRRFREKPKGQLAVDFFEAGTFYWNSGIFVWKAATILDALGKLEKEMHKHIVTISNAWGTADEATVLDREFAAIEGKSIDYAVMEHYNPVMVVEAPFQWDDLGSWKSLERLHDQDESGNTVHGRHLGIDTSGTIVRTEDEHLIVTVGLEDLIVVHTPDATLVCRKDKEEDVRKVVELLQKKDWKEYL